jgi:hypothetical protein
MAFQKIDKKFVLSDSSLNVYGMRLLTSGYMLEEYAKNPIGYYGHKPEDGVLIRWDDVALDGDSVVGYPAINLDHPRGQRTVNEVLDGFLNSASVGKLCILEYHLEDNAEDPENPTVVVTKWYNKECSLVDNPGNRNAMVVECFDVNGDEINLSDLTDNFLKQKNMAKKTIELTPKLMGFLNLSDEVTQEAFEAAVEAMHGETVKLAGDLKTTQDEVTGMKETAAREKVAAILDKGLSDGKYNAATRNKLETQFAGKPDELADLVDGMTPYTPIVDQLDDKAKGPQLKDKQGNVINLADCTYDQLDKAGHMKMVKANHPDVYARVMGELKDKQKK